MITLNYFEKALDLFFNTKNPIIFLIIFLITCLFYYKEWKKVLISISCVILSHIAAEIVIKLNLISISKGSAEIVIIFYFLVISLFFIFGIFKKNEGFSLYFRYFSLCIVGFMLAFNMPIFLLRFSNDFSSSFNYNLGILLSTSIICIISASICSLSDTIGIKKREYELGISCLILGYGIYFSMDKIIAFFSSFFS